LTPKQEEDESIEESKPKMEVKVEIKFEADVKVEYVEEMIDIKQEDSSCFVFLTFCKRFVIFDTSYAASLYLLQCQKKKFLL
jgi:hypothetical protein